MFEGRYSIMCPTNDYQETSSYLDFYPEGNSGVFTSNRIDNFDFKNTENSSLASNGKSRGHKLFSSTVTFEKVLTVFNKLSHMSRIPFIAQFLTHPTVPQEVKNTLISYLYNRSSQQSENFPLTRRTKRLPSNNSHQIELPQFSQTPEELKIIAYVFENINLSILNDEDIRFVCEEVDASQAQMSLTDAKVALTAASKNPSFYKPLMSTLFLYCLGGDKLNLFFEALPSNNATLDFLVGNSEVFKGLNSKQADYTNIVINKARECLPGFADMPDSWVENFITITSKTGS